MNEVVGRAGFHATHTKDPRERGAILHEMMRELDDDSIAFWAARNPNIVVADEALNEAMVNDGEGGFRRCVERHEVIEYGDARLARLSRKLREDRKNSISGKSEGGTVTTTMIVAHLPKSMCVEVPDYYPVLEHGRPVLSKVTGEPKRRSRWVARDRDEARRYFEDVVAYLATVVPGGVAGVHAYDIQHSESTPHVQILTDTFGDDPKKPGALRADASRAWFSHRDVLDENGRQKSGKTKMRDYHAGLKSVLLRRGYDISPDFDEERHLIGHAKAEYGQVMDAKRSLAEGLWEKEQDLREYERDNRTTRYELEEMKSRLTAQASSLNERESELPRLRRRAYDDGKAEGQAAGREVGIATGQAAAKQQTTQALATYVARLRASRVPELFDDFLDRKDAKGRPYRPIFERFVDQRLKQFEAAHGVTDDLVLQAGDREQFIEDGGARLGKEVAQLQRDRTFAE